MAKRTNSVNRVRMPCFLYLTVYSGIIHGGKNKYEAQTFKQVHSALYRAGSRNSRLLHLLQAVTCSGSLPGAENRSLPGANFGNE